MNDQEEDRKSSDVCNRLHRRENEAAKPTGEAASTEYEMIVIDECGEKADRFLYRKAPLGESGFVGHSIRLDAQDQVQTGNFPVTVVKTAAGAPPDSARIPWGGTGMAGDQMVFGQCEDGQCHYTQIQDVPTEDEIRSQTLPDSSLRADLSPVSACIKRSTDEELVEVTTREGISVKMLRAHDLLTMGDDGKLRKIRPGEMVEGETIIPRVQPAVPFGTGPNILKMETRTGRGKQLEIPLDREAGFLFGMYVAEGSASGDGYKTVSFAAREEQLQKRVASVLNGWDLNTWNNDDYVSTTCTALGREFAETCGTGAENKRIPDVLWTAPPAFRDGFISGYLSGDGTVNCGEITASTSSKMLAEDIVFLLSSMGVRASYRAYEQDEKEQYQDQHLIKFYQSGIENLPSLALTRKQKIAQQIKNSETKFSRDRIPVPGNVKTETARAFRENDLRPGTIYQKDYASRPQLKRVYGDLPDRMQALVNAPIWWEVVESVEKVDTAQHTYDLSMERRSNLMVGAGLIVRSSS